MGFLRIRICFILFTTILSLSIVSCKKKAATPVDYDFPAIEKRGKLIALTDYTSTSYFIYRGTPMGFQHDLLRLLADHLNLDLQILVNNDLDEAFDMLTNHECDLLAINLTVIQERQAFVNFTEPIGQTRQILVQRKPRLRKKNEKDTSSVILIRNPVDLGGKRVYIQKNSAYLPRLKNLEQEIGDSIAIFESDLTEEQLIKQVARGEIDYTVADEEVALLNSTYYNNIDVETAISFPQNLAWAVSKETPVLLDSINAWINSVKGSALFAVIYEKYFEDSKALHRIRSPYFSIEGGKISPYDKYIKKYSHSIDWDWRLLASMIYQESRFNPNVTSWAGAFGLMQLMPQTADYYGVSKKSPPEQQIKAGVKLIKYLNKCLKDSIPDDDERIKFILASYNVGLGHILDAMRLATVNDKNPRIWDRNVDSMLLSKSDPDVYNSPLVHNGYCRGDETYNFVKEVMNRYEMYKTLIPSNSLVGANVPVR